MKYLLLLFLMISGNSFGEELHLLEPRQVYVDVHKNKKIYDDYMGQSLADSLTYGAEFNVNMDIVKYGAYGLWWDNNLHFDQSSEDMHIKAAGWRFTLGIDVLAVKGKTKLSLIQSHHSQHVLEETRDTHFPLTDSYGIRLSIYP
jgi:hypothetical protein